MGKEEVMTARRSVVGLISRVSLGANSHLAQRAGWTCWEDAVGAGLARFGTRSWGA